MGYAKKNSGCLVHGSFKTHSEDFHAISQLGTFPSVLWSHSVSQPSSSCFTCLYISFIKKNTLTISENTGKIKCWQRYWHIAVKNHCHTSHTCHCQGIVGRHVTADWLPKHGSVQSSEFSEAVLGAAEKWSLFSINKHTKHLHKYSTYRLLIRCCGFQNKRDFGDHQNCQLVERRHVKTAFKSSPDKRMLVCFLSSYAFIAVLKITWRTTICQSRTQAFKSACIWPHIFHKYRTFCLLYKTASQQL